MFLHVSISSLYDTFDPGRINDLAYKQNERWFRLIVTPSIVALNSKVYKRLFMPLFIFLALGSSMILW